MHEVTCGKQLQILTGLRLSAACPAACKHSKLQLMSMPYFSTCCKDALVPAHDSHELGGSSCERCGSNLSIESEALS